MMELRHLRTFLAVADALHFGRAARRLHVSQPAVSQQVHQLEQELGAPLFERRGRGVRLTQAGEVFRAYATRALEDVQAGQRALAALEALEMGELRVAYIPSLTTSLVVPAVEAALRKHPGLRVVAYEGVTSRVERRVAEGKVDVGLGFSPAVDPEVEAEEVLESRLAAIVPRSHALAALPRVPVAKLGAEPLALLARGLRIRRMVDQVFGASRVAPRVVFETHAVASVLALVRAGLALTILPEPHAAAAGGLVAVPLSPAPPSHFAALLFRRAAPRSFAAAAFADEVRAVAARRVPSGARR